MAHLTKHESARLTAAVTSGLKSGLDPIFDEWRNACPRCVARHIVANVFVDLTTVMADALNNEADLDMFLDVFRTRVLEAFRALRPLTH